MLSQNSKKSAHLVLRALHDIDSSKAYKDGVSARKLTKIIKEQYQCPENYGRYIVTALERGVACGAVRKSQGKYHLSEAMKGIRENRRRRRRSRSRRRRRGGSRRRRRRRHSVSL